MENNILELNGLKYSRQEFPGYKFRAMVKLKTFKDEHVITIYTTDTDRENVRKVMADRRHESVTSVNVFHWASKEQDDLTAKFIDETLKNW